MDPPDHLPTTPSDVESPTDDNWDSEPPRFIPLSRTYTDETMDNRPGAGRALDNVYQYLGRKLERGLGNLAEWAGFER